jgi:hypothetical protein
MTITAESTWTPNGAGDNPRGSRRRTTNPRFPDNVAAYRANATPSLSGCRETPRRSGLACRA